MKSAARLLLPAILLAAVTAIAAERVAVPVEAWLVSGPAPVALPAFHDEEPGKVALPDLLGFPARDVAGLRPREGADGWRRTATAGGAVKLESGGAAEAWLFTYVEASRWVEPTLELDGKHPLKVWLDGKPIDLADKDGLRTAKLKLEPGLRRLAVRTLRDPALDEPWTLRAALALETDAPTAAFVPTLVPTRPTDIRDELDTPKVSALAVSPDGELVALSLGAFGPDGKRESWLEVRRVKDGTLALSWRGALAAAQPAWLPDGKSFSYVSENDGKSTVWIYELATGTTRAALRDVEHFQSYAWNPDGRSLVYAYGVEAEADKRQVKRLRAIEDRWPGWRDRSYLVEMTWPGGVSRRLTAGAVSAESWSFSPDGACLLFSRTWPDPRERPYARAVWSELNLADLAVAVVLEDRWIDNVSYGPDRNSLLVTGSPSAFDGLGNTLPAGVTPNDYGGQLYLYDRGAGKATPLTRDLDSVVQSAVWRRDGRIVAEVLDGQYVHLTVGTRDGQWRTLDTGVEVVGDWEAAGRGKIAVCVGTGAVTPQRVTVVPLGDGKSRLLLDPGAERFADVTFGRVEPFAAALTDGTPLDGLVYYPRDYVPGRKYPVIVFYYGGTSPITREFGTRYPKNVWTGQGYFVYVPNPSGAVGYGQEFAARHVNDWGRRTAGEVIEGTKAFLAAFPDADGARMGCIGASYGGFLTLYLIGQTDMFRAAVSHAGISNISSYWAGGHWGYSYGGRALAGSFPWNAPDLYVEQSPLYHADRITTPVLLLHGADDTNVPPGESDGMYIALTMLGKEVEYVQVEGQNHHILDHDRRIVWNDTILAWFARELLADDGWWKALYPD
ncbi:MAG: prolyl oligopeptidase family serine peptidase [Candidatus Latescibacteria bacterium]|nr:prolyl oligopeptidase family serine peptidase [Candidatus Latescibacterota bacterium]